jgi:hypothetical protein
LKARRLRDKKTKDLIREMARDPGSVQFRNVVVVVRDTRQFVCGEFNAKNGFGGYAGFTRFLAFQGEVSIENGPDRARFSTRFPLCDAASEVVLGPSQQRAAPRSVPATPTS